MSVSDLPIVVVPGIQGHWEWMRPALAALRTGGPVSTFSLNEEDGRGDPFDQWMASIDRLIAGTGSARVALVGVSFGGLVVTRYAAMRPDRVAALVLVSAPSPRMPLGRAEQTLVRYPLATLPFFALRGVTRLAPEVIAAKPTWMSRATFALSYGRQVLARPIAPRQMARWVRAWQAADVISECSRVTAPTHVITGERGLDRVVPVDSTLDYLTLIPGATASVLARTGHIGLVSRPDHFAALVREFLHVVDDPRSRRSA
jgi:pimeloyl-ACP methyl ester carboxylesterase